MFRKQKKRRQRVISFQDAAFLADVKPKEQYVFHSDYYKVDDRYCTIMSFFRPEGSLTDFGAFWGVAKIPRGLGHDVNVILFDQVRRMTEGWLSEHQSKAESVAETNENEQLRNGTNTTAGKASKKTKDLRIIAEELQNGASYLNVKSRILVSAPSLEALDDAVRKLERLYIDRFATLSVAPYTGLQSQELSTLFDKNDHKEGKGFYFTSTEYAGSHFLVTHGLDDPKGEYVGDMIGDVNTSAILFDVDRYEHHCVVADSSYIENLGRVHAADLWGSKISQACLLNNHKVVHLILDGLDLNRVGPKFSNISYKIDMNHGDVNMFEMFGDRKDQLAIFPGQMQKLILMAEQAYTTNEHDRSVIRGTLESVATKFYIDNRMWRENAIQNEDSLRIVGIAHEEVPKLEMFVSYLDTEYKAAVASDAKDQEQLHALSVLAVTFRNMLSNNGDLFNTTTTRVIDGAKTGRRVIYDFSRLMMRGVGVAMAQLVNVIGFAVGNLGYGDTVIIHGAENIDDGVKRYLTLQFDKLFDKGGRVIYCYNSIDKMLDDKSFSEFDRADYTIFGSMSDNQVRVYQNLLGQGIPEDLSRLITTRGEGLNYIRRGYDNVVFRRELQLGLSLRRGRQ